MSSSSVFDYITQGVSNTYTETVDYWSKEGSLADGADAVAWGVKNPDTVARATGKGIKKSAEEFGTAVTKDSLKLVFIAGVLFFIYRLIDTKARSMGGA